MLGSLAQLIEQARDASQRSAQHQFDFLTQYPLAFPAFFVGMWVSVSWILAMASGWRVLATRFSVRALSGSSMTCSGSLNGVGHNGSLVLWSCEQGLGLSVLFPFRIGHPPLLVPWSELQIERTRRWFGQRIRITLGARDAVMLELTPSIASKLEALCGGRIRLPSARAN